MPVKYICLAESLRKELASHTGTKNWKLPTEQELCSAYQVSRQTVRQALSLLEKEGLILRRQGSGTYAAPPDPATHTAAVILPSSQTYLYPSILRDLHLFFRSHGYYVQVFTTENLLEREREILESLLQNPVSALLVKGSRTALPNPNLFLYEKLEKLGTAIAFWDGGYSGSALPVVDTDNRNAGFHLASYLAAKGHKNIGGIFQKDDRQSHQRYLGCAQALVTEALPLKDSWFYWYDTLPYGDTRSHDFPVRFPQAFLNTLRQECSAVICTNDQTAYYLIQTLREQHVAVPGDLAVAGFDNSYLCELGHVGITSLSWDGPKSWLHAAQLLIPEDAQPLTVSSESWHIEKRDSG